MLRLSYGSHFRKSEIVSFNIKDIIYVNNEMKIRLRRNKIDQEKLAKILKIAKITKSYLHKKGVDLPAIMQHGGWTKVGTVMRCLYVISWN